MVPESFAYAIPEKFSDIAAAPLLCAGLIGYRAIQRANVPEQGRLLMVGFGSSAHIVIQLAMHRGYEVFVATRSRGHQKLSHRMGAIWADGDLSAMPVRADSAILFAPVGHLVPPTLEVLRKGGTLAIAGVHLTNVPALNYQKHLFL